MSASLTLYLPRIDCFRFFFFFFEEEDEGGRKRHGG